MLQPKRFKMKGNKYLIYKFWRVTYNFNKLVFQLIFIYLDTNSHVVSQTIIFIIIFKREITDSGVVEQQEWWSQWSMQHSCFLHAKNPIWVFFVELSLAMFQHPLQLLLTTTSMCCVTRVKYLDCSSYLW